MHRFLKGIVAFIDEVVELFDEEGGTLMWCCFGVFLLTFGIAALFFAPLEGFMGGATLAVAFHMFISDWQHYVQVRRECRKRARSVIIDISELKSYSPSSSALTLRKAVK